MKRDWDCFQPFIICRLILPRWLQTCCFALGWALLSLAMLQAVTWFFLCPHAKDFGVMAAKATYQTIVAAPLFLLGSACFLFASRKPTPPGTSYLYWVPFSIAVMMWATAFKGLCTMPTRGWYILFGE